MIASREAANQRNPEWAGRTRSGLPLLDDRFRLGAYPGATLISCADPFAESTAVMLAERVRGRVIALEEFRGAALVDACYRFCALAKTTETVLFLTHIGRGEYGLSQRIVHMTDANVLLSVADDRVRVEYTKNRWGYLGAMALWTTDGVLSEGGLIGELR